MDYFAFDILRIFIAIYYFVNKQTVTKGRNYKNTYLHSTYFIRNLLQNFVLKGLVCINFIEYVLIFHMIIDYQLLGPYSKNQYWASGLNPSSGPGLAFWKWVLVILLSQLTKHCIATKVTPSEKQNIYIIFNKMPFF